MTATLDNTEDYTQADLDRFNAMVEVETAGMDEDDAQQYEKYLSGKYLTEDPANWGF